LGVGNDSTYNHSDCFEKFPFPDEDTGLTPALREKISTLAEQIDQHRKRVLGLLPSKDLTLTGLYNVLQALRQGRALKAKEKQIHSAGLVGVLKTLHDELDAAVLAAYGWGDLANLNSPCDIKDELLTRLVALNQCRATEEAQGQVRWLRPAFQNPLYKTELPMQVQKALEVDLAVNPAAPAATIQAWPSELPEQVKAVVQVLNRSPAALTLAQIEACFSGSGGWKKSLPTLLQTLAALGRAQQVEADDGLTVWRS
jgi:hypothetical protein